MKSFTIEKNNIIVEMYVRTHSENIYSYCWYDNRTNEKIYESEKIETPSKDVVYFLGIIDCIKHLQSYDLTKYVKCDSDKSAKWFLAGKICDINSYPDNVWNKLQKRLDWINQNKETLKSVVPPWKNILWKIPPSA